MYLVQLLLPTHDRDGAPFTRDVVAQTRAELIAAFGGVTAYLRAPAAGAWVNDEGFVERDQVVMVEVVVDTLDQQWWQSYATLLAERFRQQEMHIRTTAIEVLSVRREAGDSSRFPLE